MRSDIDFNFNPHPLTGDIIVKKDIAAVEQSIRNLVLSNFYERGFNYNLGGNVTASLFDVYTPSSKSTLQRNIKEVLYNFEPGAEVVDVEIDDSSINGNELGVIIVYNAFNDPTPRRMKVVLERVK